MLSRSEAAINKELAYYFVMQLSTVTPRSAGDFAIVTIHDATDRFTAKSRTQVNSIQGLLGPNSYHAASCI